jgi:hypothetical protein
MAQSMPMFDPRATISNAPGLHCYASPAMTPFNVLVVLFPAKRSSEKNILYIS